MDWHEFHSIVNNLITKLTKYTQDNSIQFDAIAPILRSGAIPATMIANKMQIVPVIPVQVKYNYDSNCIDTLIPPLCPRNTNPEEFKNILVVESNTHTGGAATLVYELMNETFPNAAIHYTCTTKVYGGPKRIEGYKSYHYGCLTNEAFKDNAPHECREGITIFPWETVEFELGDINHAQ